MQSYTTQLSESVKSIEYVKNIELTEHSELAEHGELAEYSDVVKNSDFIENIRIIQPEEGYRFSIDPFLLVSDIVPESNERILDIGTGCGIMPLLLAFRYSHIHITAVEIQKELADMAQQNFEANQLSDRIRLINDDIRQINCLNSDSKIELSGTSNTGGQFDRVISNPPYKKKGSGRLNPDLQKAIARHEITLCLDELLLSAARFLKPEGLLNLIYPVNRLTELISSMNRYAIKPLSLKYLHTKKGGTPKLVLVSGIKQA
ncbi:MAG: methyltransferase [Desulfamplus sp.]|nr:methyltransferase [Desulfamplus sp.]